MAPAKPGTGQKLESIWKLGGLGLWQLTKNVARGVIDDDLAGRASGMAFNFLLALFPLLLFILTLFGLFTSHSNELQSGLLANLAHFLPPTAFQLFRAITLEMAANATNGKLTFSILLTLWFASGGMSSIISTLNAIYNTHEYRSWFRVRAIAVGLTIAISVFLLSSLFIVLVGGHFIDWIGGKLHLDSGTVLMGKGLQWLVLVLFVALSFALIYYCGPNLGKRRWHWITPGSMFGGLLWLAISAGFRVYLHFFNSYTATYGSLGAMMMLLVWLHVTGLAFLIGGEINAQIERAAARDSH